MRQRLSHIHFIFLISIVLLASLSGAAAKPKLIFSHRDAAGDDFGAGSIQYPDDETFVPGVFDIVGFTVLADDASVIFRFQFTEITNPWNAPEGYYHQRIDVFIDSRPGIGKVEPLRPGPGEVLFDPDHPWDLWLRVAPWDGAQLFGYSDSPDLPGRTDGIHVHLVDPKTIEVIVPQTLIPHPETTWNYYVLVGSFDGLGIDGYRTVVETPTRWLLGGFPGVRIVDLVGPTWGARRQSKQLGSVNEDGSVMLYPIGAASSPTRRWLYAGTISVLLLIGTVGWLARRRA